MPSKQARAESKESRGTFSSVETTRRDHKQTTAATRSQGRVPEHEPGTGLQFEKSVSDRLALQYTSQEHEGGDPSEREAERIADAVTRSWEAESVRKPRKTVSSDRTQRMCPRCRRRVREGKSLDCEECRQEIQRSIRGDETAPTPNDVERAAAVTNRPGRPLSGKSRSFFKDRMGGDFSDVRIHAGAKADRAARSINARAFTLGRDIAFRSGEYDPDTQQGRRLLAHELTHVQQQNSGGARGDSTSPGVASAAVIQRQDDSGQQSDSANADESDSETTKSEGKSKSSGGQQTGAGTQKALSYTRSGQHGDSGNCIPTKRLADNFESTESFTVHYAYPDHVKKAEIQLKERGGGILKSQTVNTPQGTVTIDEGLTVNQNARYHLRMKMTKKNGAQEYAYRKDPRIVKFQLCRLLSKPSGTDLTFAKMIYAEGGEPEEFPWVRDLVYNRRDWVENCPKDKRSFGEPTIKEILSHENQFESVLSKTPKFKELETELDDHSGPCEYTTSPRNTNPRKCLQINEAIRAVNQGDQNTHDYVFFRSDTNKPSPRAHSRHDYSGGNHYWKISGCPDKQSSGSSNNESGESAED